MSVTKIKCPNDEAWRIERNKTIGGSDAAAILGLNPYKSAYALWCEKTGKLTPVDISDKEAVRLGNDLEEYVAKRFTESTGKRVRRENHILRNSEYPFAHASVDRIVVGENAGLECKTTSSWDVTKQLRDGEIPDNWYCQCVHYMMVTGADRWYLAALAFGSGFYEFTIERNEDEIQALVEAERAFYEKVGKDIAPELDGSESTTEAVKTIFGKSLDGASVDMGAVSDHIDLYLTLEAQIKELQNLQDGHANCIKDYMGVAEKGTFGNVTVSWKSASRKTFDKALFEEKNGKISEEYYKTSESRTFRITQKKAKK